METISKAISKKLDQFRSLLNIYSIDAYIIPHNDAHNSEYISKNDERLKFISGFSGSNGFGLVSQFVAWLWTDPRYYIQAVKQLEEGWEMKKLEYGQKPWYEVAKEQFHKGAKIGYDPHLIDFETAEKRKKEFEGKSISFIPLYINLVDELWKIQKKPKEIAEAIFIHSKELSGTETKEKINKLKKGLDADSDNTYYYFTANLMEIAWLLNLRGSDIAYNPVFISYLLIKFENDSEIFEGTLFIDEKKITPDVEKYLKDNSVIVKEYESVFARLNDINNPIFLTKSQCNHKIVSSIRKQELIRNIGSQSVIDKLKAIKSETEIKGFRECHLRDGAALVAFLAWLENELVNKGRKDLNEFNVTKVLEEYRKNQKWNKGLSFETISCIGPNSAIIHYAPKEEKSELLDIKKIYLLDSGGQYLDGTTDVTRTVHFSNPTNEEKSAYTRVLLGNLDVERMIFPNHGISGNEIDVLARRRLWEVGLDYGHGTGHGVGYFLSVHEGPHGIGRNKNYPLQAGMIVTNEPGYYKEGSFGIRVENCLLINNSKHSNYLEFENITMCPYNKNLMDFNILTQSDIDYINRYHEKVRLKLMPLLLEQNQKFAMDWLLNATEPIKQ